MIRLLAGALALSMALAGAAQAQDAAAQQEALDHNAASNAALDAGDFSRAAEEAVAAWRAAERGWGDDPNTAELAMMATVNHLDNGNAAAAREPAARALELAAYGQSYTEADAQLWYGMALAASDPAGAQTHLQTGLAAMDAAGTVNEDTVRARMALAVLQFPTDPEGALAAGLKGVEEARQINSPALRAHLFELGKLQYLAGQFGPAAATLADSLNQWERPPVGEMPPALANTYAWQVMAGRAAFESMAQGGGDTPPGPGAGGPRGGFGGMPFRWGFMRDVSDCNIDYEQVAAAFPAPDGDTATLGAAVVMYDFDADGNATNVQIVGAAPDVPRHVDLIQEIMSSYKARRFVREPCRAGHITQFTYQY